MNCFFPGFEGPHGRVRDRSSRRLGALGSPGSAPHRATLALALAFAFCAELSSPAAALPPYPAGTTASTPFEVDGDLVATMEETEAVEVIATPIEEEDRDSLSPTAVSTTVAIEPELSMTVDLGAALRRVPGVAMRRTGSPGGALGVSIRGSAADQIVVTLAGLPLTPPGGGPVDLSAFSPTLLDGLSVTRGSEGAAHGAGALGGVLHLQPIGERRASTPSGFEHDSTTEGDNGDHEERSSWLLRADSLASGGSAIAWRGREGRARLSTVLDLHATAGRFSYDRVLTPSLPDATAISQDRANNGALLGSGLISAEVPGPGGVLQLTGFGHTARHEVAGMVGYPTPGANSKSSRMLLGGAFESDAIGHRAIRWSAAAWLGGDSYDYHPGEEPAPGAGTAFENARQVVGVRSSIEMFVAGTALRLASSAAFETLGGTGVESSRASGSLTLSDTAYLFHDRLEVFGALRLDSFSGHEPAISPRAGARLDLTDSLFLLANLGRGVRMPALFELHGETALISSNEDLHPESALTVDGGIELRRRDAIARLTLWHSRYEDLIAYELYPPLRLRPMNIGAAIVRGLEAESAWAPLSWLDVSLAYTFTDAINLSAAPNAHGRILPYRPRHRGLVGLRLTHGRFEFLGELEAQSTYPRNRANTKWIPARLLAETGAGVKFGDGFFARVTITNLLDDRRLEDLFGYPLPGRAAFFVFGFDR